MSQYLLIFFIPPWQSTAVQPIYLHLSLSLFLSLYLSVYSFVFSLFHEDSKSQVYFLCSTTVKSKVVVLKPQAGKAPDKSIIKPMYFLDACGQTWVVKQVLTLLQFHRVHMGVRSQSSVVLWRKSKYLCLKFHRVLPCWCFKSRVCVWKT